MAFLPRKTAVLANDAYVILIYLYYWVRRLLRTRPFWEYAMSAYPSCFFALLAPI
jgi:hypothetical protein